ncbi:LTA synthase family protein [Undibacterium sp.]|jgi:hypothetical protein|uniref:LTA synthase family protein n=1 Tax=Undibacterium sp. TaxID=1914977 RepID=UPI002C183D18|nr:LTA synthase family protein [Undibacterium sp.]HTD04662.1 LTA synthase family protein [Undibacterium sp.]
MANPTFALSATGLVASKGRLMRMLDACLLPLGFPLLVLILGQYLGNYIGADSGWEAIAGAPFSGFVGHTLIRNCNILFLNWMVLSAFWAPILLLSRRPRPTMLVFLSVYLLMILGNALKVKYRSEPLFPWDIGQLWQMLPLANSYLVSLGAILALPLVAGAGISWLASCAKLRSLTRAQIIVTGVLCAVSWAILSYVIIIVGPNKHLKDARHLEDPLLNITWAPLENAKANLLPLMLAMNVHIMDISAPANYEGASQQLLGDRHPLLQEQTAPKADELPDIVIVLSESFFNLNRFPSLRFNTDPTPSFTAEEAEYGANVVTPAYGGGTANVEFEILTGLRMAMLPSGAIPYMQYITKPLPTALPQYLKTLGYETMGIHTFEGSFWKRKQVYPLLGIDRFIDSSQFAEAPLRGPFIRDSAMADRILKELDSGSKKPKFIFAATMENHGGYADPSRYTDRKLRALNAPTPEMQVMLDNYAEGMHDADQSFAALAAAVRQRERPTLLIFFGDHLSVPLHMMEDAEMVSSDHYDLLTADEQRKIHTVQAILVSNQASVGWPDRHFQMNDMGPQMLRAAGIPMSPYWQMVDAASHEMPAHIHEFSENAAGQLTTGLGAKKGQYLRTMQLLTYDLLFGDQHLVKHLNELAPHYVARNETVVRTN